MTKSRDKLTPNAAVSRDAVKTVRGAVIKVALSATGYMRELTEPVGMQICMVEAVHLVASLCRAIREAANLSNSDVLVAENPGCGCYRAVLLFLAGRRSGRVELRSKLRSLQLAIVS